MSARARVPILALVAALACHPTLEAAKAGPGGAAPGLPAGTPSGLVTIPAPVRTAPCAGSCLYVDAGSGSDDNDGRSPGSAFRTLNRAAAAVSPGTTVVVMSGTYSSDGSRSPLELTTSGRPDAWITFTAGEGQHPVIQLPRGPGAWAGINLVGVAYVVIDGFEVVGLAKSIGAGEAATNDGTQAYLNQHCIYVDGAGFGDFHPPVPHDLVIRNNVVHDCTSGGIDVNVADAVTIAYNQVFDCSWWTVFGTSGISLLHLTDVPGAGSGGRYRNFVVGNVVRNVENRVPWKGGNPPGLYDGNGIIVDDTRHRQAANGIRDVQGVPYEGRTYLANNVVHQNGGRGIHVWSSAHVDVVNNTAYDDVRTASPFLADGEIDAASSVDVNVVNNVAVNLAGKPVTVRDGNAYDYNVWSGVAVPYKGPHDVVADAQLRDPAGGDMAPRDGSPAVGTGTATLAPAVDLSGRPRRPDRIDRGAVQVSQ